MQYIDIENWNRKEHFLFFSRMDYPQFNICMNIDITNFLAATKRKGEPFYYAMIFAASKIINEVEAFRLRIRDEKVILHEVTQPSFTDINGKQDDPLFKIVTVNLTEQLGEFTQIATETSQSQTNYFEQEKLAGRDDLIFITCLPWISFTSLSHTISLRKNDSVPRISWGKYFNEGDKVLLPFSVQANHALLDGYHVGKYVEKLQAFLDGWE